MKAPPVDRKDREAMIKRWQSVGIDFTILAAQVSTSGADWRGCSKTIIYNDLLPLPRDVREMGIKIDQAKFIKLMDKLASAETQIAQKRREILATIINEK